MTDESLLPAKDIASHEAASFVAQLDRLTSTMWEDIRDIEAVELEWQAAPGMNTIGMLLAHIAIVEVYWIDVGVRGVKTSDTDQVLGLGIDDDGIPLAPASGAPATLKGKDVGFYDVLLVKARAHTHSAASQMTDADMERTFERKSRKHPEAYTLNVRWVFYHMLEHLAGHYGQVLLLRHMYRAQVRETA
jgi:uncharacterized damage-inducible protein DinB